MIERPIPQDILKYKQKALGNFSARELIFGVIGAGIIAFFCMGPCKAIENVSYRIIVSALPAIPFFLIGFVKLYGVPFEKCFIPMIKENFIDPMLRKKEIHDVNYEKRQKTRYWLISDENKKNKVPSTNGKKLICKPSQTLKGIK